MEEFRDGFIDGLTAEDTIESTTPDEALPEVDETADDSSFSIQLNDDEMVFRGAGPFLDVVEEKYGEKAERPSGEPPYAA